MTRADSYALLAALASGYLIGGVPFGYLTAHFRGVDIRDTGSGNIGATNVGRALGRWWGMVVLLLDIAKGFVPVFLLAPFIAAEIGSGNVELVRVVTGLGTILGHVFTPYLGFRGGKGVATSIGVFAALCSYWIAMPLAAYGLVRKLSGYVSAGSIALALLLPLAAWLQFRLPASGEAAGRYTIGFAVLVGILILIRHSTNIARLVSGTEHGAPGGGQPGTSGAGEREAKRA